MKNFYFTTLTFFLLISIGNLFGADLLVPSQYPTIQDAVTAANSGDRILVSNGSYTINATLNINKSNLSIIGESTAGVIINLNTGSGWGLWINASGVTLQQLTLVGPDYQTNNGGYPIHASTEDATVLTGITVDKIVSRDANRTGIDFNGVNNSTISNITSFNRNRGNGLQLTDCNNIILSNITTYNNAWGGLAIYTKGSPHPGGSDNITINGINSFGESNPMYCEIANNYQITNVITQLTDFDYIVKNNSTVAFSNYTWYRKTKDNAKLFALSFADPKFSTIKSLAENRFLVYENMSIQSAIDAGTNGSTIDVYPGNYFEKALNRYILGNTAASYQFGLFIEKNNVTIQGVDVAGTPISDPNNTLAFIKTNSTANFGPDGIFVQGNNFSLKGIFLKDNYNNSNVIDNNKAIEIIADGFNLQYCKFSTDDPLNEYLAVYLSEWDASRLGTIQSYNISNCIFDNGSLISINNGAGSTGIRTNRTILNNTFNGTDLCPYSISFRGWSGANPVQGWILYPVGGAVVTGNIFNNSQQNIFSTRGNNGGYIENQFDWNEIWTSNSFSKKVIPLSNADNFNPQTFLMGDYPYCRGIFSTLQAAIDKSVAGNTIKIGNAVYTEGNPQIIINKNLTLSGTDKMNTIIKPAQNTGNSEDLRGWIFVNSGINFNLNNVTLDGAGKLIYIGILSKGPGVIENNIIKNIGYNPSGPDYAGRGIAFYECNMTIKDNLLTNIGRIGIYMYGLGVTNAMITGNTYLGKGNGNWLDYGVEIEGGAKANVTRNTITNCTGIASTDGSTSAGSLITTYFATGSAANYTFNTITNSSTGIAVGFTETDASSVIANNNTFGTNDWGITSTAPLVDGRYNWWGNATGPYHPTLNPGGLGDKVSDFVTFTPWVGSVEQKTITNSNLNTPVNFTSCNTSLTFTSLPPGTNSTVSIQRIESSNPPTGVPGFPRSAGNGLPLYLMITATGLTNYTFSVTVVVDVSNINGFNPNTKVMYYSTASNSWVGIQGVYSPSAKTFTFTTDHFTPFGFVNPENPNDIYLAQVVTDPVNTQKWYPAVGMGDPAPSPDWKYSNISATYYVVPTGTTGMFSSKFAVVWDKSKANLSIEAGDFWNPDQIFYSIDSSSGNNGRYWIHVASQNLNNQVPGAGKYIAKLNFTNIKPGYIPVSIDGTDFRYYYSNGDSTSGVYVTTHPGKIIFYLGDVGKTGDETMGDGRIQFEDLSLFSAAYWSINGIHAAYKYKFDIGPTNANGSYWALPTPDGKIEFEDLNIFAIGYGKTSAGQLPDNPGENKMKVSTLAGRYENGYYKVPVKVSGVVRDFRTGSFEFSYQNSELDFAGFERKGGFEGEDNFMLAKAENGKIMLDAAIVGAEKDGMNGEQVIFNLLFTEKQQGSHNIGILSARARYSSNTPIDVTIDGNGISNSEIPTVFSLEQNYPNPFNPVTTIKYGLPKDVKVSIVVYDVLGREVMTLANEYQKAGYHQVEFRGDRLASGTYFYRLIAGDFTSIKKMVLVK